jgi:hypothetical protein
MCFLFEAVIESTVQEQESIPGRPFDSIWNILNFSLEREATCIINGRINGTAIGGDIKLMDVWVIVNGI